MEIPPSLIDSLRSARRVVVLTGAGVSAESGISTFRDSLTGIWAGKDPAEVASAAGFKRDPEGVWRWYAERRDQALNAAPNAGHYALAEMERHVPEFTLATQNVDGLHQGAGSRNVYELHGSLHRFRCLKALCSPGSFDVTAGICRDCGGRLRPDVIWFGESLPYEPWKIVNRSTKAADVFFSVGTSGHVFPAAGLASLAARRGAIVVEVNNASTLLRHASHRLKGEAGTVLPALVRATWPRPGISESNEIGDQPPDN